MVVDALVDAGVVEELGHVLAFLLSDVDLLLIFKNLCGSLFAEHFLDTRNDTCDLNDLLHEHIDITQQVFMRRVMNNRPVNFILCLQYRVDFEDWDEFLTLRVTDDALVKIEKGDLHGVLESFKQTIVKFLDEFEPLTLDFVLAADEQFVVCERNEFYDFVE